MTVSGRLVYFPWLVLPEAVRVGDFLFVSIDVRDPSNVLDSKIAQTVSQLLSRYQDRFGKPITNCTIVLQNGQPNIWDIPENRGEELLLASHCLAFVALSEQRFFEQSSPKLNSSMFRGTATGITAGADRVAIFAKGRDGGRRIGNVKYSEFFLQEPLEVMLTKCPPVNKRLVFALEKSSIDESDVWQRIEASLPFFLLGHSEATELPDENCVFVSAVAFEHLLGPYESKSGAFEISKKFAALWNRFPSKRVSESTKVSADPKPNHFKDQQSWSLRQKWVKELYETRNKIAHGNAKEVDLSSNWEPWQHLVISAFAYPLTVKLLLEQQGYYQLSPEEFGACSVLDRLIESGFEKINEWEYKWPEFLQDAESDALMNSIIRKSLD